MKVYKTKKGYFYKEYKNGKKKRISKEEYQKLKTKKKPVTKKKIKQKGGGKRYCSTCTKYLGDPDLTLAESGLLDFVGNKMDRVKTPKHKCKMCETLRKDDESLYFCANNTCGHVFDLPEGKYPICFNCKNTYGIENTDSPNVVARKTNLNRIHSEEQSFKRQVRNIVTFHLKDVDFNQEVFYRTQGEDCYRKIYGNVRLNNQQNRNRKIREALQPFVNECIKVRNNTIFRNIVNRKHPGQKNFYNIHGEECYKEIYGNTSLNNIQSSNRSRIIRQRLQPHFTRIYKESVISGKIEPIWSTEKDNCQICNEEFSMIRTVHHCRWCGLSICKNCLTRGVSQGINPLIKLLQDYIQSKQNKNLKSKKPNIPFCKDLCFDESTKYQIEISKANRGVRAQTTKEEEAQRLVEQQKRNSNARTLSNYQRALLNNKEKERKESTTVKGHGVLSNKSLIRNIKLDIIKVRGLPETNAHLETNWTPVDLTWVLKGKAPPTVRVNRVDYNWTDCLKSFKKIIYYYFEYREHLFSQQLVTKQKKLMNANTAETAAAALRTPAENKQLQKLKQVQVDNLKRLLEGIQGLSNEEIRTELLSIGLTPREVEDTLMTLSECSKNDFHQFGNKLLSYQIDTSGNQQTILKEYITSLKKLIKLNTQGLQYLRNVNYHNIGLWRRDIETLKRFTFYKFKFRGPNEHGNITTEESPSGLLIGLKRIFCLIDNYATYEPESYFAMLENTRLISPHRPLVQNCHNSNNTQEWNVRCNLYLKMAFGLKIIETKNSNDNKSSIKFKECSNV